MRLRHMRTALFTLAALLTLAACGDDSPEVADEPTTAPPSPGDCAGDDWVTVDTGKFSFRTPADLVDQEVQGIDSLVGQFVGDTMTLGFDFGRFSGNTADQFPDAREEVTIDGLTGDLIQIDVSADPNYGSESDWMLSLYVAQPGGDDFGTSALALWVRYDDPAVGDVARCITEKIDFADEA
jgi:hypothetical protein